MLAQIRGDFTAEENKKIAETKDKVLELLKSENLTCDSTMQCLEDSYEAVDRMLKTKCSEISGQEFRKLFETCRH